MIKISAVSKENFTKICSELASNFLIQAAVVFIPAQSLLPYTLYFTGAVSIARHIVQVWSAIRKKYGIEAELSIPDNAIFIGFPGNEYQTSLS